MILDMKISVTHAASAALKLFLLEYFCEKILHESGSPNFANLCAVFEDEIQRHIAQYVKEINEKFSSLLNIL